MNKIYNIVVIGCGHIASAHLDDIYYRENINIYGVVDLKKEARETFKRKYNADSCSDNYMNYLKDEKVDIVIICTYPSSHLGILRDCLKYNKHVICEKPITDNLEDGKEFTSLVKSSNSKVLIGHILRHNESYIKIKEMINNGYIGHPIIMRMVQNHHCMNWEKYLTLIKETSPIIDCGVHYLDIMRWITSEEFVSVSGICQRTEMDVPEDKYNYGMITLKMSNGSVGFYEAGWGKSIAAANIKEFIGPKGRISLTYQNDRSSHKEEGDLIEFYDKENKTYNMINSKCKRKPTFAQLENLIDMIENNVEANPSIDDVFKAFYVATKADEAIKSNTLFKF